MQRGLPRAVWALGLVSLLMDTSSEMIHGLLPVFLVAGLGASAATLGVIEGVAEATALIIKVFAGMLSDRRRRRKPLTVLGYAMSAATKPLFAIATSAGTVFAARVVDRIGKGIRGAPRDALIADIVPPERRGAAFGLRQALDTVGAFAGPLFGIGLMALWHDDFRAVFRVAVIPAALCVAVLALGVREPPDRPHAPEVKPAAVNPMLRANLARLGAGYWRVVLFGALLGLAHFSEAFLILRVQEGGLAIALSPLVLVAMNVVYGAAAYPLGKLSDRGDNHHVLLLAGLALLVAADGVLAWRGSGPGAWIGIGLWGLHMAFTQGLLSRMVADAAPADLRGTAFGMFNLVSGFAGLAASVLAGVLWDRAGPAGTFVASGVFGVLAAIAVQRQPSASPSGGTGAGEGR